MEDEDSQSFRTYKYEIIKDNTNKNMKSAIVNTK